MSQNYQVRTVFCNGDEPLLRFDTPEQAAAMYAHDVRVMIEKTANPRGAHVVEVRYIDVIPHPLNRFDHTVLVTTTDRVKCTHN